MIRIFLRFTLPLLLLVGISSCGSDTNVTPTTIKAAKDYDAKVVTQWQDLYLEIERYAEVYRPCPAARSLGYIGLAAYESAVPGMPDYQSVATHYPGLTIPAIEQGKEYHWPTVVNNAYAAMFKKFFANVKSSDQFKIASLESSLNVQYSNSISSDVYKRSRDFGQKVASAVWDYSATDKEGHDKYLDPRPSSYTPPTGVGKWTPTPPGLQSAMFPYWGKVRTFALPETEKTCRPPLPYSDDKSSAYYAQGLEVYSLTTPQTSEAQWIAEFWSDDVLGFTFSPPSRWIAIGSQALTTEKSSLETGVLVAVKVGMALNDASVGCWGSKYIYNIERPVSYIQRNINPNWNITNLTSTAFLSSTPSFPAYPSGHATFGSAAAEALNSVFGYNYAMTDRCHEGRTDFQGKPRAFNSFDEMAYENAISRVYLGVHWRMDAEEALRFGKQIGRRVNGLPFKKVQ